METTPSSPANKYPPKACSGCSTPVNLRQTYQPGNYHSTKYSRYASVSSFRSTYLPDISFVVFTAQFRIAPKRLLHLVGPLIRLRIILLGQLVIHGLRIVHFIQIGHRLHRGKESVGDKHPYIPAFECQILPKGFRLQLNIFIGHLPFISPVAKIISLAVQHFGSNASGVLAI